jgi:exosortase
MSEDHAPLDTALTEEQPASPDGSRTGSDVSPTVLEGRPASPTAGAAVPAWALYVVAIAFAICFSEYLVWMVERWWTGEYYGHGFLIPIISGYLIAQKRSILKDLPREGFRAGLPLMAFGLVLHVYATYLGVNFASGFSFLIAFYGAIIWLWGWPVARCIAFPIAYLVFMVPLERLLVDRLAQPMQLWGAKVGGAFSQAIGIPTQVEGVKVHIPNYTFEVAVACSGLKSVISMSALGTLYAYMVVAPWWKRAILIAATLPVALAANVSRIAVTLVLGQTFGEKAAEGFTHTASGVLVFVFALIGLFLVGGAMGCTKIRDDI